MELDMTTFEELKEMSGADFIDELVDTFLEDAPKLISEMKSALQTKDAESFHRAAHSFKSNSATFGANRLSAIAREMELLARDNKLDEAGSRLTSLEDAFQIVAEELKGLRK